MYGAYDNFWLVRALNWPNHFIMSPLSNKLECAGLLIRHLTPIEPWCRSFSDQNIPFSGNLRLSESAQSVQGCREINGNTIALWPVFQVLFISSSDSASTFNQMMWVCPVSWEKLSLSLARSTSVNHPLSRIQISECEQLQASAIATNQFWCGRGNGVGNR